MIIVVGSPTKERLEELFALFYYDYYYYYYYYYHYRSLHNHPSSAAYDGLAWPPHNSSLDYAQMLEQCTGIIQIRVCTQSGSHSLHWNGRKRLLNNPELSPKVLVPVE